MAETILTVSLKEYKKSIEELRGSLLGLTEDSDEYKRIADEISERQKKLNDVMTLGKRNYSGSEESLNGLKKKLSELRREFDGMDIKSPQWKALQAEIATTTDKISEIEQGMGIFSRNVGNYANSFQSAMKNMGVSVKNPIAGIQAFKTGMDAASKTPFLAILSLLVTLFFKVKDAISGSEQTQQKLNKAFASFQPIIDLVTISLQKLADGLVWVVEKAGEFIDFLFGANEKYAELQETTKAIAETEAELTEKKRQWLTEEALINEQIAKLEEIATDRENRTLKERKAAQEEMIKLKQKIADKNLEIAEQELALAKLNATNTENDKKTNDELAELERNVINMRAQSNKVAAQGHKEMRQFIREERKDRKDLEDDIKKQQELEKQRRNDVKNLLDLQISVTSAYSSEWKDLRIKQIRQNAEYDKEEARQRIKDATLLNETLLAIEQKRLQDEKAVNDEYIQKIGGEVNKWYEMGLKNKNNYFNANVNPDSSSLDVIQNNIEKYKSLLDYQQKLGRKSGETQDEYTIRLNETASALKEAEKALADYNKEQAALAEDNRLLEIINTFGEDSYEVLVQSKIDAFEAIEKIYRDDFDTEVEFLNAKLEAQRKYNDAAKALDNRRKKDTQSVVQATTSILGDIGTMYENNIKAQLAAGEISDEEAKRQFENVKKLQYTNAIINTLASVMQIWGDASIPSYWVKIPLAAAQLANGLLTAQQINQQTIGGGTPSVSTSTPQIQSVAATPLLNEAMDLNSMQTINVTGDSEGNRDSRVYILESDIADSNNRVETRQANTTF